MLVHPNFDPVAIALGPVKIHWYGLSYLLGFTLAWALGQYRARKPDWPWNGEQISDLLFYVVLGIIIGGRLGSVLFYNFEAFLADPSMLYKVWQGGMSFHGGLIGVIVCLTVFARKQGKAFWEVGDMVVVLAPAGIFCGRIGNFINGELWGGPTDLPWGMVFHSPGAGDIARHPSQLYEAGLEGLALLAILWVFTLRPRPRMAASALFLMLYAVFRSLVEFVREPDAHIGYLAWGWVTMGQVLSLPMFVAGVVLMVLAYRNPVYDRGPLAASRPGKTGQSGKSRKSGKASG